MILAELAQITNPADPKELAQITNPADPKELVRQLLEAKSINVGRRARRWCGCCSGS